MFYFVLAILWQIMYFGVCTQILVASANLCFQAVIFEPSRPLVCIKQLVYFILELCCDVIPWAPLGACIPRDGRHKLVSEPTACRTPPSNSLVEVESSRVKLLY